MPASSNRRDHPENRSKRLREASGDPESQASSEDEADPSSSGVVTPDLLRAELAKLSRVLSTKVEESVERLRQELGNMQHWVLELENHVEQQGVEIDTLRSAVARRDDRISELESAVTELEMERNRSFLIFDGPAIPPRPADQEPWEEDVAETIAKTVRKYLPDIEVRKDELIQSYRVGRGKKIVCQFVSVGQNSIRERIYQSRVKLGKDENGQRRERDDQLFVNERLCDAAEAAYARLRKAKREGVIYSVFTRQGHIYVRLFQHGQITRVRDWNDLSDFLQPNAV